MSSMPGPSTRPEGGKSYAAVAAAYTRPGHSKEGEDRTATAARNEGGVDEATVSGSSSSSSTSSMLRPNMPRQRSRGQIARRNSITRGSDARSSQRRKREKGDERGASTPSNKVDHAKFVASQTPRGIGGSGERPWFGGLYFTDIVFIAFTYSINLLRTLGLAELADVVIKGIVYAVTQLPFDLYTRWSLSTPPFYVPNEQVRRNAAKIRRRRRKRQSQTASTVSGSSSDSDVFESLSQQPAVFASSLQDQPEAQTVDQLSPFHHLVILLSRFACDNFPHLLPRVLFAEETIGPFVYWRTGGGSNAMVQEFTDLSDRQAVSLSRGNDKTARREVASADNGGFRAYLLSKDARMPIEVQRSNLASRSATTLLYLHGGGFSLGSVAFYAEALLRLRAKVAMLETKGAGKRKHAVAEARCVAVEYDLSPAARFPQPLLQCLRCYAHLIEVEQIDPESICLAGDSAGGNLAMGMLLCLSGQMRDEQLLAERDWSKLPMPGKAVLISPWVDLRPKDASAFAELRNQSRLNTEPNDEEPPATEIQSEKSASERAASAWTEAVFKYDWDFVASEALLHFAQVYAGVMPSPRRVYGPLGWIAHVCGVLTMQYSDGDDGQYDEQEATHKSNGFMDLSRAFSILSNPSRRLAKVTYDALSDPILPRLLGLKLDGGNEEKGVIARSDSITAGFEPLFTPFDRRTDVVASMTQLHEPIDGPLSTTGLDKIGMDQNAVQSRLHARHLLDTHPLLSPAIGDWSGIKLKYGCLVTWGERERMAEDIERWVESVVNDNPTAQTDAPPAPDGEGHAEATVKPLNRKGAGENDGEESEWMYTAVEKGPGGVHAWPYVSMYLAGTESERERGLDLLARFVARESPADLEINGSAIDEASTATAKMEKDAQQAHSLSIDPPHAAPASPDNDGDGDSVGSMPSDVDLHGLVDEGLALDYDPYPAPVNIADAVRRAQELGYTDTELAAISDGETTASEESSKQITPRSAPRKVASKRGYTADVFVTAPSPPIRPPPRHPPPAAPSLSPTREREQERGRSRSPRKPVHLATTTSKHTVDSSHFVSGVTLHIPQTMQRQQQQPSSSPTTHVQQSATPLWWTGSTIGTKTTREVEPEDRPGHQSQTQASPKPLTVDVTPKAVPVSLADDSDVTAASETHPAVEADSPVDVRDTSQFSLDDIQEASSSEEALSPSLLPSDNDITDDSQERLAVDTDVAIDPSFYGLSRWAIRRPEPEGLSDIAEEGSVLSASITSAGGGDEDRSRSLSPANKFRTGVSDPSGPTSLAEAATQFMRDHKSSPKTMATATDATTGQPDTPRQWRYLRDEIGMRRRTADEEEDEEDEEEGGKFSGDAAFSPPAKPQPGRSLPVVTSNRLSTSGTDESTHDQEQETGNGAININRKKPKGDVWW